MCLDVFSAGDLLARIAESQLGVEETPHGSNRGEDLKKFFEADDYVPEPACRAEASERRRDEGYPWCASFVSWCVQEMVRQLAARNPPVLFPSTFHVPRLCRAFAFQEWGEDNNCHVFGPTRDRARGDIVVFNFSHVGIVTHASELPMVSGFQSVEGNTNEDGGPEGYEVARRLRRLDAVKCFVRLPDPLTAKIS
jgi:hypothetical protein